MALSQVKVEIRGLFHAFSVFDQPRDVMNINEPSTRRNWRQTLIHYGDKLLFLATSCRKLNMLNFGNLSTETSNLSPETETRRDTLSTSSSNLSPATSCWNLSIVYRGVFLFLATSCLSPSTSCRSSTCSTFGNLSPETATCLRSV